MSDVRIVYYGCGGRRIRKCLTFFFLIATWAPGYGTYTYERYLCTVPMIRVPLFPAGYTSVTLKPYFLHELLKTIDAEVVIEVRVLRGRVEWLKWRHKVCIKRR